MNTNKGLSLLGLGTVLLIIWRFAPLNPGLARMALWEFAIGALVVGMAVATVAHCEATSKEARALPIVIGAALLLVHIAARPFFQDAKVVIYPIALALIYAGVFAGRTWKIQVPVLAIFGYILLGSGQDPMMFSAFPNSMIFLGMVAVALIPYAQRLIAQLLMVAAGIGFLVLGYLQVRSTTVVNFDGDALWNQGSMAMPLALGAGLLLLAGCAALPEVGLLVGVAKHAASLYVLALLATLPYAEAAGEADFGWTMYAPLTDAHEALDPFEIFKFYGDAFPNWWLLGLGLVLCGLAAYRRRRGPLEAGFATAYRRF